MLCNHCGAENPDGSTFCASCKKQLSNSTHTDKPFYTRFRVSWREFVASPLSLVLMICFSLNVLLNIHQVNSVFKELSTLFDFISFFSSESTFGTNLLLVLLQILICAPGVLVAVGLWMIYDDAHDRSDRPISSKGLNLIYVAAVYNMISFCIAIPLSFYGIIMAATELSTSPVEATIWSYIFFSFIFGAIGGFYIARTYVRLVTGIRDAAENCVPSVAYIAAGAVLQLVTGSLYVVALFSAEITFAYLLSAALPIFSGIILLRYKRLMENLYRAK